MDIDTIKCLADDNGWKYADPQPDNHYLRFVKNGVILDLWNTTGTIRIIKDNKAEHFRDNTPKMIEDKFKIN